jgi:hypothetical protein
MILSDHNWNPTSDCNDFKNSYNVAGQFLVLCGEEITDSNSSTPGVDDSISRPQIHVISFDTNTTLGATYIGTAQERLSSIVQRIMGAGGIAIHAHPGYTCCPSVTDFNAIPGLNFIEVNNPATNESQEKLWDAILSGAKRAVFGIGVDDEHNLTGGQWANPGKSWTVIRAASLTAPNIREAFQNGDFYASDGVELADLQTTSTSYFVQVNPAAGVSHTIVFVGKDGVILNAVSGTSAKYMYTGSELYVRAQVFASNGTRAWTQPIFPFGTTPMPLPIKVVVSPASPTIQSSGTAQFTATVTGTPNTAVTWSISPSLGIVDASGKYIAPAVTSVQSVRVDATSVADPNIKGSSTITINPLSTPPSGFTPIRINSGGGSLTDSSGNVWAADASFSGNGGVVGDPAKLYESVRYGDVTYSFPNVPTGTYQVTLKFMEISTDVPLGRRLTNLFINEQLAAPSYDILAAAGGYFIPIDKTFTVTVGATPGVSIRLASVNYSPIISGIEIVGARTTPPPTPVTVAVSPSNPGIVSSAAVQFTAAVTGTGNTRVLWSISPALGSINPTTGVYTAPVVTSTQTVTVMATSIADPTVKGSTFVTVNPATAPQPITVGVTPATSTIQSSGTAQFTATVSGTPNTAVTWSISPALGGISSSGLYTAPVVTSPQTVIVTATSVANTASKGTSTVTVNP